MKSPFFEHNQIVTRLVLCVIMPPELEPTINHYDRESHGFAYNLSSAVTYHFDNGPSLFCGPGQLIYLPKHSYYHVERTRQGSCACINFEILDDDLPPEPFLLTVSDTARLEQIYTAADKQWSRKAPSYYHACMSNLYDLMAQVRTELDRPYLDSGKADRIADAVQYINDAYTTEDISVVELAAMSGMSEVYFRRLFKARCGVPPAKYIKNRRIERAKELILSSLCTIEAAGQLSGFSDPAYFCREFKSVTGMTPTEYRNHHKNKE
ncbi:MAG: helix-turn-helix transcriptional regulator [Clostridia bacterium]|nr:helix-turn-helix transcriptional regulator [Clostridia bacterium]